MVKYNPLGLKRHKIIDFDWLNHVSKITMIMSCLSLNLFLKPIFHVRPNKLKLRMSSPRCSHVHIKINKESQNAWNGMEMMLAKIHEVFEQFRLFRLIWASTSIGHYLVAYLPFRLCNSVRIGFRNGPILMPLPSMTIVIMVNFQDWEVSG